MQSLNEVVSAVVPDAIQLRRELHRQPELSNQEFESTRRIADRLEAIGYLPRVRMTGAGLTADIGDKGPRIAFRADIDALPIHEQNDVPYRSARDGIMHACGHDVHAAIGLGIAAVLTKLELPGSARFIFQHAEEDFPGGAYDLIREGAIDNVDAILAYHVDPKSPPGTFGMRRGPITSSSDRFHISIEGPGGHTARPHETVDTVFAAGKVVTELPTLVHRSIDARTPLALVFGTIRGGFADNIIPDRVELGGTCRVLDRDIWDRIPGLLESLTRDIVAPTGAKLEFHYERGVPPVINDPGVLAEAEFAIAELYGRDAMHQITPSMGAEDFSRYLEKIPGAMIRLGAKLPGRTIDLHSPTFDANEDAIAAGILAGTAAMLRLMECDWS